LRRKLPYTRAQLLLDREDPRRQQAAEAEHVALPLAEGGAFVEQGIGQDGGPRGEQESPVRAEAVIWIVGGHGGYSTDPGR